MRSSEAKLGQGCRRVPQRFNSLPIEGTFEGRRAQQPHPHQANAPKRHGRREPVRYSLDGLIEEATVDAYGESEQTVGFYTMLEDRLALPFKDQLARRPGPRSSGSTSPMTGRSGRLRAGTVSPASRDPRPAVTGSSRLRGRVESPPLAAGHAGGSHGTTGDRTRPGEAARGDSQTQQRVTCSRTC